MIQVRVCTILTAFVATGLTGASLLAKPLAGAPAAF
jgi:hypothetical protein